MSFTNWAKALAFAGVVAAAPVNSAIAQAAGYQPPRDASGKPDLQGIWSNASMTQLERAATLAQGAARTDPNAPAPPRGQGVGGYNNFWVAPGSRYGVVKGQIRSSWIVEPVDGRIPYTSAGRKALGEVVERQTNNFEGPEPRGLGERCLMGFGSTAGPPMLNVLYNNNYQIVQTADHVMILVEMNHDARIVRLNSQHLPSSIHRWMGDSIGWWEGDTLVVETTNFNPAESLRANFSQAIFLYMTPQAKVTERFTRWSQDQILYEFKVEDPSMLTQPWRAEMALNRASGPIFEYACPEGNYAMPGILAGARRDDRLGRKSIGGRGE